MDPFTPTPEQLDKMFSAMDDSVWVINQRCTEGPRQGQSQLECNQEIDRNARHLELMLSKEYIQDALPQQLLPSYQDAIVEGDAYIAAHGGLTEGAAD